MCFVSLASFVETPSFALSGDSWRSALALAAVGSVGFLGAPLFAATIVSELFQQLPSVARSRPLRLTAVSVRAVRDVLKERWNGRTIVKVSSIYAHNTTRLKTPFRIARAAAIAIAIGSRGGGIRYCADVMGICPRIVRVAGKSMQEETLTYCQGSLGPGSLRNLTRLFGTLPCPCVGDGQRSGTSMWSGATLGACPPRGTKSKSRWRNDAKAGVSTTYSMCRLPEAPEEVQLMQLMMR
jgi:hypothetical protein